MVDGRRLTAAALTGISLQYSIVVSTAAVNRLPSTEKNKTIEVYFFNKCFTFCNQYSDFPFHLLTLAKII
jgi:hypothetical protein